MATNHYTKIPGYQHERDLGEYLHPVRSRNATTKRQEEASHKNSYNYNAAQAESNFHDVYHHALKLGHSQKNAMHMALAALGHLTHEAKEGPQMKYKGGLAAVPPEDRPPAQDTADEPAAPALDEDYPGPDDIDFDLVDEAEDEPERYASGYRGRISQAYRTSTTLRGTASRHRKPTAAGEL